MFLYMTYALPLNLFHKLRRGNFFIVVPSLASHLDELCNENNGLV